jgi:Tfp pilus assembly protein PilN
VKYSLTTAREKKLLDTDTELWLLFTVCILSLFIAIKFVLTLAIAANESQAESYHKERSVYETQIETLRKEAQSLALDVETVATSVAKNKVIKDSMINLLDLIPDQIYLTDMQITETTLRIKGYTPSQDIYNYLLKPPLESIFAKTVASFLPGEGGYVFDSFSVMGERERLFYAEP